ncbi:probable helicase senataxin isoform X2 [Hetaerina americana]|uniref:probable helicase senataxin isoform X2 n=1 Tax=Hetaerina americana TaxID=62018 RepID=UPI003A7F53C8
MKWLLVREDSGLKFHLSEETKHGIGRARECFIKCQSLYSSRHHCDIIYENDEISIVDLSSSNGTFVNGGRIAAQVPIKLKENDVIGIGVPERIDVKSILFKVAIEVNGIPASHHSLIEEGSRKRNSTSNDDTVPLKISRLDVENASDSSCTGTSLNLKKDRWKNNSSDLGSFSLVEQSGSGANDVSLLDSCVEASSGNLQDIRTDKSPNAEVIDLVESDDDEIVGPVNKSSDISPEKQLLVKISGVNTVGKGGELDGLSMNTSGYTDENDVIVISDDEDDLFSSSIPTADQSKVDGNEDNPNQEMVERVEKEHLPDKSWEGSDSEESDNEWWPKLSQSFSESFEDHIKKEPPEMEPDNNSRSDEESNADFGAAMPTDNCIDEVLDKPSVEEKRREESDFWFPVLSQENDESDDFVKDDEEVDDRHRNGLGDDDERTVETEGCKKEAEMDVMVNSYLEDDEKDSDSSESDGHKLIICEDPIEDGAASVSECAQVLEKVKISPVRFSLNDRNSDKNDRLDLSSSVDDFVDERKEHGSGKKKLDRLNEIRLSLENKRGPVILKAPFLLKGRTCLWEDEGSRENKLAQKLPPASPSCVPSVAHVELKKCSVILEDVMYGKNRAKSKMGSKLKASSSKGKAHVKGKEKLGDQLTKEDKKRIKAERKAKLQALSDKIPKEVSPTASISRDADVSITADSSNVPNAFDKVSPTALDARPSGKVFAKVTEKNRGAFLTEFDLFASSSATASSKKGKPPKKSNVDESKPKKNTQKSVCGNENDHTQKLVSGNENDQAAQDNPENDAEKYEIVKPNESNNFEIKGNSSFLVVGHKEPGIVIGRPGILKPSNRNGGGKKKKVTFNDDEECKMFLIEPGAKMLPIKGKDYPLPLPPGGGANVSLLQYPSINSVVYDICRWNAHWLEEQRSKPDSEPPPVHLDHSITPLVGTYASFVDYYKCFYPILLYEMWARIYKEWDQSFARNPVIQVLLNSHNDVPDVSSSKQEFICVHCQCVVSDMGLQNSGCPKVGDLVIWEFAEESGPVASGNFFQHNPVPIVSVRVFAYVDSLRRTNITPRIPINQCFGPIQKNSSLLHMTLKFKKRKEKICLGEMGRLKVVCHLLSELRSFDALLELPKSPLMNHILNPLEQDVKTVVPGHFRLKSTECLNPSQKRAVAMAKMVSLAPEPRLCMIQGPPGTGKTKVIITLLMEMFGCAGKSLNEQRRNHKTPKILLCAPSNAAIDHVVMKLLALRTVLPKENRFRLVRVGRLESMNPAVRDISLQELTSKEVKNNANCNDLETLELHISTLQAKINSILLAVETVRCRNDLNGIKNLELKLAEYQQKLDEAYQAKANNNSNNWSNKDMRNLELMAERMVLQCADIVATTLASSTNASMMEAFPRRESSRQHFSCCIIDEACQSLEVDSLIPLKLGISKLVLVGDQQQLYPTVMSLVAKQNGLQTSLFERLWSVLSLRGAPDDSSPLVVLNVQYRMHPEICHWPNIHVYQGILKTPDDLVMERQSPFLPYVILSLEYDQNDPNQLLNGNEAELVSKLYFAMHEKTEKRRYSIGIITPYQKQKDAIEGAIMKRKSMMKISSESQCEVNTIDSFQGQERDVVIMSCVRSYRIGFLGEMKRINVALTRARRSLIVCGNFNSLKNHELWNAFLSDGVSRGVVRCVSGSHIPNQRELLNLVSRGSNE